jgi:hypothetical protein
MYTDPQPRGIGGTPLLADGVAGNGKKLPLVEEAMTGLVMTTAFSGKNLSNRLKASWMSDLG